MSWALGNLFIPWIHFFWTGSKGWNSDIGLSGLDGMTHIKYFSRNDTLTLILGKHLYRKLEKARWFF